MQKCFSFNESIHKSCKGARHKLYKNSQRKAKLCTCIYQQIILLWFALNVKLFLSCVFLPFSMSKYNYALYTLFSLYLLVNIC